jgi:hypothetical protein
MKNDMTTMKARDNGTGISRLFVAALALACLPAAGAAAASPTPAPQKTFASPEQAVEAVVTASATDDVAALAAIFGPDGKDLINSGDSVQDEKTRSEFVRLAREKTTVVKDPKDSHRATFTIGENGWPSPIPLVEQGGKWRFASKQGVYEVLLRHIGSNELDAIAVCRGYVEAQKDYAIEDPDKTGVHQYAQRIISTPGKHDGLYWKHQDGGPESPIGEEIAKAIEEGYSKKSEPYHGYFFKVLTAQGKSAPLGAMSYVIKGNMIGGFALVAWPAKYRVTGVKTFLVGSDGIVYQQDLGPDTAKVAAAMTRYNPDKSWVATEDEEDADADGN